MNKTKARNGGRAELKKVSSYEILQRGMGEIFIWDGRGSSLAVEFSAEFSPGISAQHQECGGTWCTWPSLPALHLSALNCDGTLPGRANLARKSGRPSSGHRTVCCGCCIIHYPQLSRIWTVTVHRRVVSARICRVATSKSSEKEKRKWRLRSEGDVKWQKRTICQGISVVPARM